MCVCIWVHTYTHIQKHTIKKCTHYIYLIDALWPCCVWCVIVLAHWTRVAHGSSPHTVSLRAQNHECSQLTSDVACCPECWGVRSIELIPVWPLLLPLLCSVEWFWPIVAVKKCFRVLDLLEAKEGFIARCEKTGFIRTPCALRNWLRKLGKHQ